MRRKWIPCTLLFGKIKWYSLHGKHLEGGCPGTNALRISTDAFLDLEDPEKITIIVKWFPCVRPVLSILHILTHLKSI